MLFKVSRDRVNLRSNWKKKGFCLLKFKKKKDLWKVMCSSLEIKSVNCGMIWKNPKDC